jgi:hypothetical protein
MLKSKSLNSSRQTKESVPEAGVVLVTGVVELGLVTMPNRHAKFPTLSVLKRE